MITSRRLSVYTYPIQVDDFEGRVVKTMPGEMWIEFTKPSGSKFVKHYKEEYSLQNRNDKIAMVKRMRDLYIKLKEKQNVINNLSGGWTWELVGVYMPYDRIEILAEIKSPHQTFRRRFQIFKDRNEAYVNGWINKEASTLIGWIKTKDKERLEEYLGKEVILDGSN